MNKKGFGHYLAATSEPPAGVSRKVLLKAARQYWSHKGVYPEWYYTRKKELDNQEKVC